MDIPDSVMVKLHGCLHPVLLEGWKKIEVKFADKVAATSQATETNICCALALRITRLAEASAKVAEAELEPEIEILLRSAVEAYVNLCYIFHTGPRQVFKKGPEKSTRDLCLQFASYADIAYMKLVRSDPDRAKEIFIRRNSLTESEYNTLLIDQQSLESRAFSLGCQKDSWHQLSLADRAKRCLKDPAPFFEKTFGNLVLKSFVTANSAVHSDGLSLRLYYKSGPLNLLQNERSRNDINAAAAACLAFSSWEALGWLLGEQGWVKQMVTELINEELIKRARSQAERGSETRSNLLRLGDYPFLELSPPWLDQMSG